MKILTNLKKFLNLSKNFLFKKITYSAVKLNSDNINKPISTDTIDNIDKEIDNISSKLKEGIVLLDAEVNFLSKYSPKTYELALSVEKERNILKKELHMCTSKEDVNNLKLKKDINFISLIKSMDKVIDKKNQIEKLIVFLNVTQYEHSTFIKTDKYANLMDK